MRLTDTVSQIEAAFERWRRVVGAVAAPLALVHVYVLTAGHLSPPGRWLAAILSAVAILWVTETLPLPVTALLGACLCIVFGVADAKTVLAPFADSIVFLFIGSFMLARAMTLHGLDRRVALAFLASPWVGGRPARILLMLGAATALTSMWVSNTATAAMMTPIAIGILDALRAARREDELPSRDRSPDSFATALLLMVAYAASVGGIATPVGSPPNLICLAQLRKFVPAVDLSFFRWMALMVPMLVLMYAVLFAVLWWMARDRGRPAADEDQPREPARPRPPTSPGPAPAGPAAEFDQYLCQERRALGPWTVGQVNTLVAFSITVSLWVLPGVLALLLAKDHPVAKAFESRVPEAVAALAGAVLLFVLPTNLRAGKFTLGWQDATTIDWGTILLFGGGLSLGGLMFQTGVAEALGRSLTQQTGIASLWGLTAAAVAIGIVLSETSSNTASANMVIPVIIALAQSAGVNPVPPALGACLGASYGFMLPVSTPPNAIVYSSGRVPIARMIRAGLLFDLCGFAVIVAGLRLLCPLLGLS